MTDYSKMSDFEINGLIAKHTQKVGDFTQSRGLTFIHECGKPVSGFGALCLGWKEFDPCNNPADAWQIIVKNHISICSYVIHNHGMVRREYWEADVFTEHKCTDKNPLRAAMIVFLMMQEKKE